MTVLGVGVMHNTVNSRFGPKPLIRIRFIVTGRSRDEIDEAADSDIAKVFTLNSSAKDWARGATQPSLRKGAAATAPYVKAVRSRP